MKKLNIVDIIDGSFITAGVGIALQDLQSILSIIILALEGAWLIAKLLIKTIKYFKDGELSDEEIKDLDKDFTTLKKFKKGGEENGK